MEYKNPTPTTDVIVYRTSQEHGLEVLLIERSNPPHGWALPGGFVDEGEMVEAAAVREVLEETHLSINLDALLFVYSNPNRDTRQHNLSVVYTSEISWKDSLNAKGGDDAAQAQFFSVDTLPTLVFDHSEILQDFMRFIQTGEKPHPMMKWNAEKL